MWFLSTLSSEFILIFFYIPENSLASEYNPFNSNSQLIYLLVYILVYIYGTTSLDMIQS